MEPTFTFRHLDSSDAMRNHVIEKLDKLSRHWYKPESLHVILELESHDHCAEFVLVDDGEQLVSSAKSSDMYASIDDAVKKLDVQLRRRHAKATHHKGSSSARKIV